MSICDKIREEITRVIREELAQGAIEAEAVPGLVDGRLAEDAHGSERIGQIFVTFVRETAYKFIDNAAGSFRMRSQHNDSGSPKTKLSRCLEGRLCS